MGDDLKPKFSCACEMKFFSKDFEYTTPPKGEVGFQFSKQSAYKREICKCSICSHYISIHDMNISALYSGDYVSSNYKDLEGILKTYNRINNLPPELSDNYGRAEKVDAFAKAYFKDSMAKHNLLDVGSGLGVFVYQMSKRNWNCTALDPDKRSAEHAEKNIGVKAIHADFMEAENLGKYDVITFNKVLEHVSRPVEMLSKAKKFLVENGFVYIELPDGETAITEGKHREEFFIDHLHIFSVASAVMLIKEAGFSLLELERLQEPSTKYTIRACCRLRCN